MNQMDNLIKDVHDDDVELVVFAKGHKAKGKEDVD